MSSSSQTPLEDCSKYPPQLCWVPRGDVSGFFKRNKTESLPEQPAPSSDPKYPIHECRRWNNLPEQIQAIVKEQLSKEAKNAPNNPTTSTKASPNPHQTCRYYFPKPASQADADASSQPSTAINGTPAAVATAFKKLDLTAQESEGEAAFEMVEKDEAVKDEDDMVVVEEPEEEEDYVEV